MELPKRKSTRLKGYDYSSVGAYFITICTKDKKKILSDIIVGDDALIVPKNELSAVGIICKKYIDHIEKTYDKVSVDHYVIMPNHIHLLIVLHDKTNIETIIRSFKTMVSKEVGDSVWQRSYHDHIIRGDHDYREIWEYIDTNVIRWNKDCFYTE